MIETYIFDLYGTLVDIRTDESMPTLWRRMALFLSLQGASYGPKELRRVYQEAVAEEIDRCAARRPGVPREHIEPDILQVFESLYARRGVSASPERVADAALLFRTLFVTSSCTPRREKCCAPCEPEERAYTCCPTPRRPSRCRS